jgi:hypothetical protein
MTNNHVLRHAIPFPRSTYCVLGFHLLQPEDLVSHHTDTRTPHFIKPPELSLYPL